MPDERAAATTVEDLRHRFTYHPPKQGQPQIYQEMRDAALALAVLIHQRTPASREQEQALVNLEQAVFWANASLARRG